MVTSLCKAFKIEADGGVAPGSVIRFSERCLGSEMPPPSFHIVRRRDWNEAGSKRSVAMHVDGTRGRAVSQDRGRGCKTMKDDRTVGL